ncbi:conjugal transfer mating-pair stabilization protein TraG [Lelliottia nimipressuralis]|uniref:Conjugal transfer mating pair stabilization protein TraG n=1 Tax=Lelliottia nimipressuralis TaxID=69220 RepID=A0ABD4KH81_9ENTR|nr:conjugal transfer mating-pair stabilization protein TraG [Lelliottia nimipressuralis]MBF4180371.1 conjugal transfer mating pair stabilization protein TraG [Lelliottia nimipressuralis]
MASVIEVYTIAGGAWFKDVFNGVAMFFNSSASDYLLAMGTLFSILVATLAYIKSKDLMELMKWAVFYVIVVTVLVGIKKDVQVIDLSEPSAIYQIDNVPAGIAVPASLLTRVGAGMAQVYDTIFARPDSLTYSKTGMMFGAALAVGSTNFMFTEPEAQRIFTDYVKNCVVADIQLNRKYTMGDLMRATDPYALIFSNPSPLRGLYDTDRNFMTCEAAAAWLKNNSGDLNGRDTGSFMKQASSWLHGFTNQVFGANNGGTAIFTEMLSDSYNWFHNTSSSSTEIIRRNVVMNGVRHGLNSYAVDSGNTAGMLNISSEMSLAKMRMSQSTSASIATHTLPIMHTVLLGMTIALFPVLVVLMVVSALSWQVLKGYIYTIAYLQMWPILFAILNHAMNFYLKDRLGGSPVVLSTMDQVQNTYSDIGTTAGWLAISIPFIAWGMVKGLGQVMSQAGNYMGQTLQGAATQSSSQAVDGTYAFNNMQTDNVQGSKWDTNYSRREGHVSEQLDNGAVLTRTRDGGTVMNTSEGMSKLAVHIGGAESTIAGWNASAREQYAQSAQHQAGYQKGKEASWSQLQQFVSQHGHTDSVVSSGDSGQTANMTRGASNMLSIVDRYAEANNLSKSAAYNELMDKSSRGSVNAGAKASFGSPKLLKSVTGLSGEVHAGTELTGATQSSHGTNQSNSQRNDNSHDKNAQMVEDFRQSRDIVESSAAKLSASHNDTGINNLSEQLGAALSETSKEFESWQNSETRAREYSEMATYANDHRAQFDQNYDQMFAEYVSQKVPGRAQSVLSDTGSPDVAVEREQLVHEFMQERVLPQLEQQYHSNKASIGQNMPGVSSGNNPSVQETFDNNSRVIGEKGEAANIRQDSQERVNNQLNDVEKKISESGSNIDVSKGNVERGSANLKYNHEAARKVQEQGMKDEIENQKLINTDSLISDASVGDAQILLKKDGK